MGKNGLTYTQYSPITNGGVTARPDAAVRYRTILRVYDFSGRSQTTLTRFWLFLTTCVDIFYGMNVDKKWTFLDHLPTSSCKRSF